MALEIRGPVPLSTLLRRSIEDHRELSFASAPGFVFRKALPDGSLYALLVDAPLDRRRLMDLLFTLKERTGATLLLITHDSELAKRCDRTVSLADGQIVKGGAKRRVKAS